MHLIGDSIVCLQLLALYPVLQNTLFLHTVQVHLLQEMDLYKSKVQHFHLLDQYNLLLCLSSSFAITIQVDYKVPLPVHCRRPQIHP